MKILFSLLVLVLISCAYSQVVGIDFGTEFWKASLISPSKNLAIIENSRSGRKSYNGIAFLEGIRHFEYDAFTKRQKKPKASYFYLNKLIESLDSQKPLEGYHFQNETYYFTEGEDTISLELMVGMILKNIKKYSSEQAGSDIKDAVFTVPAHWGFKSRMALINAAYIADLSVLGLINQNSAAAVHFAITRNDSDPVNIGFFNLGSHNLQMSIVQFFGTLDPVRQKNIESMRVLSHVSVPNIGGLQFDEELAEHIASQFKAKHNLDVHENEKSWVKLLHKCADLKQTLSANKEANIYIQGFMNGIDLSTVVRREVLERSPIFNKIKISLQEAIDKAGITKNDLHSVEVVGGASRIPLVGKIVKEYFEPVEVGSHINGDESMAFGAALRAANLSIAFRVKQLHFYDGYPELVRAVVTNIEDGVLSESLLFDKDSEHGLRKEIPVNENEADVKVSIFYGEDMVHQYLVPNISKWKERYNQSTLNFTVQPKLILIFVAHSIHFAELKEAYVNITLNTSTTKEIYELVVQNVTVEDKETSEKEQTIQIQPQQDQNEEKKSEQKEEQKQKEQQTETPSDSGQKQSKKRTRQRTKNVKKIIDDFKIQNKKSYIKVIHEFAKYRRYTTQQAEKLREIIRKYQKHENYLRQRSKIRNDLQSTLYTLKEDVENHPGIKTFSSQDELEKLRESVAEQLVWLEQNAWTAQKVDFESHLWTIQSLYNPIVNRSVQYRDRQSTYNKTIEILSLVYQKTVELNSSQPWVQEKAESHLKKINQTVDQIHDNLKKQIDTKPNEPIVFYNNQMISKAEDLREQYYHIKMIPRPKVAKKVQAPKQSTTDEKVDLEDKKSSENGENQNKQEEQGESHEDFHDQDL